MSFRDYKWRGKGGHWWDGSQKNSQKIWNSETATDGCFFELQATAPPAIVTTYLLIDFLSDSPAQSASTVYV